MFEFLKTQNCFGKRRNKNCGWLYKKQKILNICLFTQKLYLVVLLFYNCNMLLYFLQLRITVLQFFKQELLTMNGFDMFCYDFNLIQFLIFPQIIKKYARNTRTYFLILKLIFSSYVFTSYIYHSCRYYCITFIQMLLINIKKNSL